MEGYKREGHPKIEARRRCAGEREPLAPGDASILAVAADHAAESGGLPFFDLDDVGGIADFIAARSSRLARRMAERRLLDDCFLTDRERLRHDEALAILR